MSGHRLTWLWRYYAPKQPGVFGPVPLRHNQKFLKSSAGMTSLQGPLGQALLDQHQSRIINQRAGSMTPDHVRPLQYIQPVFRDLFARSVAVISTHHVFANMGANEAGSDSTLTFVSVSGPTLDKASARAMRAHTTRANFARRRQRQMRAYAERNARAAQNGSAKVEEADQTMGRAKVVTFHLPLAKYRSLGQTLSGKDAFFINRCTLDIVSCQSTVTFTADPLTLPQWRKRWVGSIWSSIRQYQMLPWS